MRKRLLRRIERMGKSSGIYANVYNKAECRWYERSFVWTNVNGPPREEGTSKGKSKYALAVMVQIRKS